MSLCLFGVNDPDLAAIAKKLPLGKPRTNGDALVPSVDPDVYEDLLTESLIYCVVLHS
jgi:hypothetical protein